MCSSDLEDFLKVAAEAAFKAGLSKADGEAFVASIVSHEQKTAEAETKAQEAAIAVERLALRKDWGAAAEVNFIIAKNTATKLGVTQEDIAALESQVGYTRVMKMFQQIGSKMGEDAFVTAGQGGGTRLLSGTQAQDRLNALKADKGWVAKFMNGDTAAKEEFANLTQLIAA